MSRRSRRLSSNRIRSFEVLENRKLMAIDINRADDGTLFITGDEGADNIHVYEVEGRVNVDFINDSGQELFYSASPGSVTRLDIRTFGGSDQVLNSTGLRSEIWGGNGGDVLTGGWAKDVIHGEAGDDLVVGGAGDDVLYGDAGSDRIRGEQGRDRIEGDNQSLLNTSLAIEKMGLAKFNDDIDGGADRDTIYGQIGNDTIQGGGGSDTIYAGRGDDTVFGDDTTNTYFVDGDGQVSGNDFIAGEDGKDTLFGGFGLDTLQGGNQDDVLWGGDDADSLSGDAGNDILFGQGGNDKLWGGVGAVDQLFGNEGDDWLDAGSAAELNVEGNGGNDFNAYITAVDRAMASDIAQGGANNCFILSSMASVANSGVDLASRISYMGNGQYSVQLFRQGMTGSTPVNVIVNFDGTLLATDPTSHFRGQEGESWTIIMSRAIAQHLNVNLNTARGGDAGPVLFALTGNTVSGRFATTTRGMAQNLTTADRDAMFAAVTAGRAMVVGTRNTVAEMTSNMFAADHVYSVLGMERVVTRGLLGIPVVSYNVRLYNPWGVDVRGTTLFNGTPTASGANGDGVITVSWETFRANFDEIRWA